MKQLKYIPQFLMLVALLVAPVASLNAQTVNGANTLSLSKAKIYYEVKNYAPAIEYYEDYLAKVATPETSALVELADSYWNTRQLDKALEVYERLYPSVNSSAPENVRVRIADLYARVDDYQSAAQWLATVQSQQKKASVFAQADAIQTLKKDSANWKVQLINVNTAYREFSPAIVDSTLLFSSNKPLGISTKAFGWDGYNFLKLWSVPLSSIDSLSNDIKKDSVDKKPLKTAKTKKVADVYECGDTKSDANIRKTLGKKMTLKADNNIVGNLVGGFNKVKFNAGSIAVDNDNQIYFSANYPKADKKRVNRIRLMQAKYENGIVSEVKALPFGDAKSYSVMHPAIDTTGTVLVFASDKISENAYDLYYSVKNKETNEWSEMQLLPVNINTKGNEVFPTISKSNILYFSSDALAGLGGLDIYTISLDDAIAGIGEPQNMGYPINSSADDFGFVPRDSVDEVGFFTSDRYQSSDNIYSFAYHEPPKPLGQYSFKGLVRDELTKDLIENATVFVYNKTDETVLVLKTNAEGAYEFPVDKSADLVINAVEKSHSNSCTSTSYEVEPVYQDTVIRPKDILLGRYKVGFKWKVDNIYYDLDKFFIRDDAKPSLDSLIAVLNQHPIKVELSSHTDCRASHAYNDRLSQKRAEAAVEYLVKNGIDPKRITAKGYGERQLINQCADGVKCTEEEHQLNRRTEVKVTGLTQEAVKLEIDPDKFYHGQILTKDELPKGFFDKCL